jgi:hypothetical protein
VIFANENSIPENEQSSPIVFVEYHVGDKGIIGELRAAEDQEGSQFSSGRIWSIPLPHSSPVHRQGSLREDRGNKESFTAKTFGVKRIGATIFILTEVWFRL